jgi:AraC-like DNA-binding protein
MSGSDLDKPTVPISYVRLLLDLAAEHDVPGTSILSGLGIDAELFERADAHVSLRQYRPVCERALALTGDPSLGCAFGLRATLTTHGIFGFGLMSQATLRDVFAFAERFGATLRLPAWNLSFLTDAGYATVDAVEAVRFEPLHRFACEQLLASLVSILRDLLADIDGVELRFDYPEPAGYSVYRHQLPPARFNAGVTQLRLPTALLDRRLRTADTVAASIADRECRREAEMRGARDKLIPRIRDALINTQGRYPDFETLAQQLHMTPRTLLRRLKERGSSYRQLLDEARRRDGIQLLEDPTLTLADIASRLGYSSAASFSRAFRAWTGETPGIFRAGINRGPAAPEPEGFSV